MLIHLYSGMDIPYPEAFSAPRVNRDDLLGRNGSPKVHKCAQRFIEGTSQGIFRDHRTLPTPLGISHLGDVHNIVPKKVKISTEDMQDRFTSQADLATDGGTRRPRCRTASPGTPPTPY